MGITHFIPDDLLVSILVRLPVKSLFRFKAVCKSWNLLISSSSFVHAWGARDEAAGKLLCFYQQGQGNDETPAVSLFDPGEPKTTDLDWTPFLYKQFGNEQEFLKGLCVIGPVHGIYCMYSKQRNWVDMVTLWSPATGQFKNIIVFPLLTESLENVRCVGIRFGIDSTTNDFKIVLMCRWNDMFRRPSTRFVFKVYDMSTNSWRDTNHLDHRNDPNCNLWSISVSDRALGDGCFVNGSCHLPCTWREKNGNRIWRHGALAFDLATESFQLIKGPPSPNVASCQEFSRWLDKKSLAMTISHAFPHPLHEVWVMTQYGVEDSWVKLYSFELNVPLTSLEIPNDLLLLFLKGRKHVGSSILALAYKAQGLPPPTSSDCERVVGVLKYEETLVGASIFNRHRNTQKGKENPPVTKDYVQGHRMVCHPPRRRHEEAMGRSTSSISVFNKPLYDPRKEN